MPHYRHGDGRPLYKHIHGHGHHIGSPSPSPREQHREWNTAHRGDSTSPNSMGKVAGSMVTPDQEDVRDWPSDQHQSHSQRSRRCLDSPVWLQCIVQSNTPSTKRSVLRARTGLEVHWHLGPSSWLGLYVVVRHQVKKIYRLQPAFAPELVAPEDKRPSFPRTSQGSSQSS